MDIPTLSDYLYKKAESPIKVPVRRELKLSKQMMANLARCKELYSPNFHFIVLRDEK